MAVELVGRVAKYSDMALVEEPMVEVYPFVDALGLGRIDCKYEGDYSSSQLLLVLDECVINACKPLLKHTKFMDRFLSEMLVQLYWYKDRHKFCGIDRDGMVRRILLILADTNRLANLKRLKVERGILLATCKVFLKSTEEYPSLVAKELNAKTYDPSFSRRIQKMRALVLDNGTQDLYTTICQVRYWYDVAQEYKKFLISKYLKLAIKRVNALYSKFPSIDRHELFQNLVMAIDKAISKCDARKGTLTTYINHWMRDAQNWKKSHTQKYNHVSLEGVTENVDSAEVMAHSMEQHQEHQDRIDTIDWIRRIAKYADPQGLGRFQLGIQEIL